MKRSFNSLLLCLAILMAFESCKSAKKSLRRGDYEESVLRAVDKLRDNARHASSEEILKEAYPLAVQQAQEDIARFQNSSDPFHWEPIAEAYTGLNRMYDALRSCPACLRMVKAQGFHEEEKTARQNAAEERYASGQQLLSTGGRDNARRAFEQFERAQNLVPGFRDVTRQLDQAYEEGSFKVVVEQVLVTSRAYQLSNEYFQNRISEFLQTNRRLNKFVHFYTPEEATNLKVRPDHVITLQFDDFVVGQTLVEAKTEVVTSKDSVKVGETTVNGKKVPVYNKVTAKLTQSRKTVHSSGLLDMQIRDFETKKVVNQEKFQGDYNWFCQWGSFNGDERALTAEQKRMCNSKELLPPPPQQLFVEFSKPIYDRLTSRFRTFYAKY
ncbi:hypothetical protein HNQ92_000783 [Rhabdobacter roseus]|uniref:Uncharacterized protein n=1 Tax=Rhabdobacter roseus TaxID=1655419 RepID=A0A840TM79_9BACT|nr:hypothetical protein [Rhabdobacter roseus]MBB5282662.1 hypothetical protein [Rhabdobacter roseus]